jgi:hypothetical protein
VFKGSLLTKFNSSLITDMIPKAEEHFCKAGMFLNTQQKCRLNKVSYFCKITSKLRLVTIFFPLSQFLTLQLVTYKIRKYTVEGGSNGISLERRFIKI